jgi:sirohydrochlorin cobaltochelatase
MKAILLVSHGSRSEKARAEIAELASRVRERTGLAVEAAFLEADRPSVAEALEAAVRRGAAEVIVLLHFLNSGNHVLGDVPRLIEAAAARHPGLAVRFTRAIGLHPRIPDLFAELVREVAG